MVGTSAIRSLRHGASAARRVDTVRNTRGDRDVSRRLSPSLRSTSSPPMCSTRSVARRLRWRPSRASGYTGFGMSATGSPGARRSTSRWGFLGALAREAGRYDVVHVTDTRTFLTASAYLVVVCRHVPLALSAHGSLPRPAGCAGSSRTLTTLHSSARCCGARRCCSLRPITRRSSTRSSAGESRPIRSLPLPLPPIESTSTRCVGSFRARIGVGDDERLLLFLGRINRLKGLDMLIESVQTLLGGGTSLAVVGRDDGQLAEIESRFARVVRRRPRAIGRAAVRRRPLCRVRRRGRLLSDAAALGGDLRRGSRGCRLRHRRRRHEQADLPGLAEAGGGSSCRSTAGTSATRSKASLADPVGIGERARRHVLAQHGRDAVVAKLDEYLRSLI